ncbi:extracellular solute-binding protein [Planococcus sp. N028]|uniref:Extracellular solute-binding protein n=1 Tax=Planococcus shixiaomingii TaxID=3058393 RepID=A0ABT8N4E1_9BACL|nr:extracellular solute-binding protein [Planococcus sp. N028]MDN7242747.1 extracellular solute-binding protein [Planococcus sp. N028]
MKKIFSTLLLSSVLILSACQSGGSEGESSSSDGPVTLKVLSSDDFADFRTGVIDEFEKQNPDIKIDLESVAYDQLHDKEIAAFNSGSSGGYDVVDVDEIWTAEYAEGAFIRDVSDMLTDDMKSGILESGMNITKYNDKYYGLPMFNDVLFFYYNEDLLKQAGFDAPPATWDEFVEMSTALQDQGLVDGNASNWGFSANEGLVCYFTQFLGSHGGQYMDEQGNIVFNNEQGQQALQFMVDMMGKHGVVDTSAVSANDRQILDSFKEGKTAFVSGWSFYWGELNSDDSPVKDKIKVALTPGANGTESSTATGSMYLGISQQSEHPEEAWKFIEFLASKDIQKQQSTEAGSLPIWSDLYTDADLTSSNPQFENMGKQLEYTLSRPSLVNYNEFSKTLQNELQAALIGDKSPKEALDAAAAKAEELKQQ